MMHACMFFFNHCASNSRVMCAEPHNEVLKYFMSRKFHTNTGSSLFLTKGRSLCCGAAGTDGLLRLTGPKNLQFLLFIVVQTVYRKTSLHRSICSSVLKKRA